MSNVVSIKSKTTGWKPEVVADSTGKWIANGLVFATEAEALMWASDLAGTWTAVRDYRAVPSDQPVNYRINKFGRPEAIK
jgi:hypothetical protein